MEAYKTHGGVAPIPTVVPEPTHYQTIGHNGVRALWVLFIAMTVVSAIFALLSWNVAVQRRIFYFLTTLTTIISALAYFAMASGQTSYFNCTTVRDHHKHVPDTHHDVCRQVFWARYVDWTLSTPLLVVELCLLAGVDGAHTIFAVIANVIFVLAGAFSAVGHANTAQKWGCVWGAAGGAWKVKVGTEVVIYAVLDVLTKAVLGLWIITATRQNRDTTPDIGGYWTNGAGAEGTIRVGDDEDGA
ncbi:hypothetical protein BFJ68_g2549 [Fusarium oxysporum]|uniref:Uncharacterized protein n=1 Tax=Fusarium oxysporum TaxID=5507 RepID=A0A420RW45_FUSOX|nr:hypothetical protein BFJ68_g2549 [Fusarium oxysporum]